MHVTRTNAQVIIQSVHNQMNKAKLIKDLLKFTIYLQKCSSIKVDTMKQHKLHLHAAKT